MLYEVITLNTFCYTGGFSVYALAGGASRVHSVDSSAKAIGLVNENVALNRITSYNVCYTKLLRGLQLFIGSFNFLFCSSFIQFRRIIGRIHGHDMAHIHLAQVISAVVYFNQVIAKLGAYRH